MSYSQELADCFKRVSDKKDLSGKDLDHVFLADIGMELAIIADEMHDINMARRAKAMYDLGIISREEMLKIFAGGEKT